MAMNIHVKPGTYIVAVSGGVDSVALLHMLVELRQRTHGLELIVAHLDHGIRPDSHLDEELVRGLAERYGLPYVTRRVELGKDAGEEIARTARYEFLHSVREDKGADAIITAHHYGDVMETAAINILRGSRRRGLSSLTSTSTLLRPLLKVHKKEIIQYAKDHNLTWREDSTNNSNKYLRNRLRSRISLDEHTDTMNKFATELQKITTMNEKIDSQIAIMLQYHQRSSAHLLARKWFVLFPHSLACEIMAEFLRKNSISNLDSILIEKMVIVLKTAKPGTMYDLDKNHIALITKRSMRIQSRHDIKTTRV